MGKNGVPRMIDPTPYIKAGVDPKTGGRLMPPSMTLGVSSAIKEAFRLAMRVRDEQDAVMRYTWYNLPDGIDGELIERLLYYRGQLAFAWIKEIGRFVILPYTLIGDKGSGTGLDEYARFNTIRLISFSGTDTASGEKKESKTMLSTILSALSFKAIYTVMEGMIEEADVETSAVILRDYTAQLPETIIPRREIQDPILDLEASCFAYANTGMINSTGISGMRVGTEDEKKNVDAMNASVERAALSGQKAIPIVGSIDFQELTGGKVATSDEFMVMAQAIDNFRLSLYGLENGGLYQKKTYVNDSQTQMNSGSHSSPFHNGLMIRQKFCDIVNSIWGLGIDCEASEFNTGVDLDGDGTTDDRKDQSGTMEGEQPAGVAE